MKTAFCAMLAAVLGLPVALGAQEPLPSFATCMDREMARFERALKRLREQDPQAEFEIGSTRGVGYCGSVGIVTCDRSDTPYRCQRRLAREQEAWRKAVLASLPESLPENAAESGTESVADGESAPGRVTDSLSENEPGQGFATALYPRALALAYGRSAGPDCAGATEAMAAWCTAWQANTRLRNAILPHQIARYLGASPPATQLGWAQQPPPTRPKARPEAAQ